MGEYKLVIEQDEDVFDPREDYANVATFYMDHGHNNMPKEVTLDTDECNSWADVERVIRETFDVVALLGVFMYDHSGVSLACGETNPFSCPWDSGQIGFAWIDREMADHEGHKTYPNKHYESAEAWALDVIRAEVETYSQCVSGDVWCYVVLDENGRHVDSCGGFFGYEYAEEEGQAALEAIVRERRERAEKALAEGEAALASVGVRLDG